MKTSVAEMKKEIKRILESVAGDEEALLAAEFLAPCVRGGQVRARVQRLVYTFTPKPRDFEGWAVFSPVSESEAQMIEEASLPMVAEYLKLLRPLRVRLVRKLKKQTWLVYPVNESDARQRLGEARPIAVHLVTDGAQFEQAIARFDGGAFWFEETDRRADPVIAGQLRDELKKLTLPEDVRFRELTPEMRTAYDLAAQQERGLQKQIRERREEARLKDALRMGGGELRSLRDHGDYWTIEWTTADGYRHTSAIDKRDLTVISAGICLSGQDRNFDLQSLVGVVESQW